MVRGKKAEGQGFEAPVMKWRGYRVAVIAQRWQWFPQPQLLPHKLWYSPLVAGMLNSSYSTGKVNCEAMAIFSRQQSTALINC